MSKTFATAVPRHRGGRHRRLRIPPRLDPPGVGAGQGGPDPGLDATSCPPTTSGSTPFAEQWSTKSGIKVTIDHVPHLQIPAKIAAEIATQSGHDIVQLVGTGTEKWASALLDVQDLADKLGKKHGGWTPAGRELLQGRATGSSTRSPTSSSTSPGLYRKDLWTEIGMPNGPDSWDDLHKGGMKLKAKGFPIGIGLAHHDDSRASWRAIMWSHGASEVAKDGKTITYNSKEMREALKFNKALYKDAMTPEVLAWDDASNNRLLASGRGSWIHNPISAYRTIEGAEQGARRQDLRLRSRPRARPTRRSFANCRAYGVTKFSQERRRRRRPSWRR